MSKYKINIAQIIPEPKIKKQVLKEMVKHILAREQVSRAEITLVLVDDSYITKLNRDFLNKDTTTDVLSFNLSNDEAPPLLLGEVYANGDQITRQAADYQVSFENELQRVLIHGVLHLIGYDDRTIKQKSIMTRKEDEYLTFMTSLKNPFS